MRGIMTFHNVVVINLEDHASEIRKEDYEVKQNVKLQGLEIMRRKIYRWQKIYIC